MKESWLKDKKNEKEIIFFSLLLLCLVVAYTSYNLFGHRIVKAAYEGKSIGILNRIIKGQKTHTQDYYFKEADRLSAYLFGSYILGIYILLFSVILRKSIFLRKFDLVLDRILAKFLRRKFLIAIIFLALVFYFKKPYLNLPAFADESVYLNGVLKTYENNLNPFIEFWGYKPPVFFIFVALLYKIFGYSLVISRLAILFFSFLTLYFTFLLGGKLYSKEVGFFAGLLLFFSPFFFAQSGLFFCDILVGALTLSTIYFFLKNDRLKYVISAGLLILTKETATLIVISIGIYRFFLGLSQLIKPYRIPCFLYKIRILMLEVLFLLSPLLFFFVWTLLNKLFLGWFLWPAYASFLKHFSIDAWLIKYILKCAFWVNFRFIITLIILTSILFFLLFKNRIKQQPIKKEILLFIIISSTSIFFMAGLHLHHEFYGYNPRYLLFIQPLFFIGGTACIVQLIKNRIVYILILGIIISLFIYSWKLVPWYPELNLAYLDIVEAHKQTTEFLEKNFFSSTIITHWPIIDYLTDPRLGYVNKPLQCIILDSSISIEKIKTKKNRIIVISKFHMSCTKEGKELVEFKPLKKFGAGNGEIFIYSF